MSENTKKKLEEMTNEELWQLFPIILAQHDERWSEWFDGEKKRLEQKLTKNAEIRHIGSTAIKEICAKPIVDILIEVGNDEIDDADAAVLDSGYRLINRESARIDYNKGYTENGFAERVFHLHLRVFGDRDELYFRDYLNSHADAAKEYEALKLSLWKKYEHDRDGYTEAKGDFIRHITELAKEEAQNSKIKQDCPCKRNKCPRHGDCAACREHHTEIKGSPVACERLSREEKREIRKQSRNKIK